VNGWITFNCRASQTEISIPGAPSAKPAPAKSLARLSDSLEAESTSSEISRCSAAVAAAVTNLQSLTACGLPFSEPGRPRA
jgi:hypothetical protein